MALRAAGTAGRRASGTEPGAQCRGTSRVGIARTQTASEDRKAAPGRTDARTHVERTTAADAVMDRITMPGTLAHGASVTEPQTKRATMTGIHPYRRPVTAIQTQRISVTRPRPQDGTCTGSRTNRSRNTTPGHHEMTVDRTQGHRPLLTRPEDVRR